MLKGQFITAAEKAVLRADAFKRYLAAAGENPTDLLVPLVASDPKVWSGSDVNVLGPDTLVSALIEEESEELGVPSHSLIKMLHAEVRVVLHDVAVDCTLKNHRKQHFETMSHYLLILGTSGSGKSRMLKNSKERLETVMDEEITLVRNPTDAGLLSATDSADGPILVFAPEAHKVYANLNKEPVDKALCSLYDAEMIGRNLKEGKGKEAKNSTNALKATFAWLAIQPIQYGMLDQATLVSCATTGLDARAVIINGIRAERTENPSPGMFDVARFASDVAQEHVGAESDDDGDAPTQPDVPKADEGDGDSGVDAREAPPSVLDPDAPEGDASEADAPKAAALEADGVASAVSAREHAAEVLERIENGELVGAYAVSQESDAPPATQESLSEALGRPVTLATLVFAVKALKPHVLTEIDHGDAEFVDRTPVPSYVRYTAKVSAGGKGVFDEMDKNLKGTLIEIASSSSVSPDVSAAIDALSERVIQKAQRGVTVNSMIEIASRALQQFSIEHPDVHLRNNVIGREFQAWFPSWVDKNRDLLKTVSRKGACTRHATTAMFTELANAQSASCVYDGSTLDELAGYKIGNRAQYLGSGVRKSVSAGPAALEMARRAEAREQARAFADDGPAAGSPVHVQATVRDSQDAAEDALDAQALERAQELNYVPSANSSFIPDVPDELVAFGMTKLLMTTHDELTFAEGWIQYSRILTNTNLHAKESMAFGVTTQLLVDMVNKAGNISQCRYLNGSCPSLMASYNLHRSCAVGGGGGDSASAKSKLKKPCTTISKELGDAILAVAAHAGFIVKAHGPSFAQRWIPSEGALADSDVRAQFIGLKAMLRIPTITPADLLSSYTANASFCGNGTATKSKGDAKGKTKQQKPASASDTSEWQKTAAGEKFENALHRALETTGEDDATTSGLQTSPSKASDGDSMAPKATKSNADEASKPVKRVALGDLSNLTNLDFAAPPPAKAMKVAVSSHADGSPGLRGNYGDISDDDAAGGGDGDDEVSLRQIHVGGD